MAQIDRSEGLVGNTAFKSPVRAATTANITLSAEQTIDGIACVAGDRVLVKNQTTGLENGIWVVSTGSWNRSDDFDGAYDITHGTLILVISGNTYANFVFQLSTTNPIIGTSSLVFTEQTPSSLVSLAASSGSSLVGFIQSGTGAVATTVQAKLRESVSVMDFGAVGDGVTDNYTAFTSAFTALSALGGGVLYVPGGLNNEYLFKTQGGVSPSIGIPSNVTLYADDDVYYKVEGGASGAGVNTYGTALFKNADMVNGNKNITIIGGRFKSTTATNCGGFLAFKNVINLHVEKVQLLDITGACRFQISYCANVKLLSGLIDYETPHASPWSFEDGIRLGSGSVGVIVSDWFINSGDDSIAINNELSETQMTITPQAGLPSYSINGANIYHITIANVQVACQEGNALRVYQGPGMTVGTISRVTVKNIIGFPRHSTIAWSTAISLFDNSGSTTNAISNIFIDGGFINCTELGTSGSGSPSAISVLTSGGNINITNMSLYNVSVTYGIGTWNDTKVINNTITGCANDGIYVVGNNNIIKGNYISGSGVYGIHIANGSLHTNLIGNRIPTSTGAAIKEDSGANYTTAIGNNVSGATACSIANNANSIYEENIGFNPQGSGVITVGASPYTYTPSVSTETVSVGGGTVSNITIGGLGMALTSGVFTLPPHTGIIVTYSSVPTMTKHIH